MAIIHCPECGNEVSDQAKKCPHCGVSVFVCPECGEVSIGEGKCPKCGYSAVPEKTVAADKVKGKAEAERASMNVYKRWQEIDPKAQQRAKVLSSAGIGLWVAEAILMAVWCFLVLDSYLHIDFVSILSLIADHKSNLKLTDVFFALIVAVNVANCALESFKKTINYVACAKWIRRSKIDIKNDITLVLAQNKSEAGKKGDETDEDEEGTTQDMTEDDLEDLGAALFLAVDPNQTTFFVFSKIIPQFFIGVLSVFTSICLNENAVSFMNSVVNGYFVDNGNGTSTFTYDFSFDWLTLVIGGAIIIAVFLVMFFVFYFVREKKIEKTLQKVQNARSK